MRPEFDRQIDSLLREHARRGGSATAPGGVQDGRSTEREVARAAHLDADELTAYAEQALPPAARARHTAHLADCAECRTLVARVAAASGVAEQIARREQEIEGREGARTLVAAAAAQPASLSEAARARSDAERAGVVVKSSESFGWRERLSSLFGGGAWRYAMPLVALVVVSAAVLIFMSGRQQGGLVDLAARRDDARTAQPAPEMHHPAGQGQQVGATQERPATTTAGAGPVANVNSAGATADGAAKSAPLPANAAGGTSGAQPEEVAKSTLADRAAAVAPREFEFEATPAPTPAAVPAPVAPLQQSQPSAAVASVAAPSPTPVPPADDRKAAEAREKDRFEERAMIARRQRGHGPMRNDTQQQIANRQADEQQPAAPPKGEADGARNRPSAMRAGRVAAGERGKEKKSVEQGAEQRRPEAGAGRDTGETRTVGGRRFRREGGAWIDTAYRSSQATVSVRRGSEQYRALVADEPELGRIAAALGGDAVIVWKGRAYRIR